jgi:transcriptional regulator GlxA family with amidase domain
MTIGVTVLLFESSTLLTLTSTLEALTAADHRRPRGQERRYSVDLVSLDGGNIETWNGCSITTTSVHDIEGKAIDTLIISGGMGYLSAIRNKRLIDWLRKRAADARRIVAMGGGVFLAAEAGLLKGMRVALHPVVREEFCARYPDVIADHELLFERNGRVITSPGMSAAADVALDLIEED